MKIIKKIVIFFISIAFTSTSSNIVKADTIDSQKSTTGIEFYNIQGDDTSSSKEPEIPSNTVIKNGGSLPITGELAQPIIIIIIGWLIFMIILGIRMATKRKEGC